MKSTDAPSKQAVPFGTNGPREAITPTTPTGSNQASYDQGFPPITMTLKSAGGLPPKGQDMNQILFEQSSFNRYFAAGGGYPYDSSFSSLISGYPKGSRVQNSTGNGFWLNTIDDNNSNPESNTPGTNGWVPESSYGITNIAGVSASFSMSTLDASRSIIIISGSLNSNINIVLPAWVKQWVIINQCTGNYSVTLKTPSGSGVVVRNGSTDSIYGDGVNIYSLISRLGLSGGSAVPFGVPIPWPTATPPADFITASGQTISQSQLPVLYSIYGPTLPDLRGCFIRGWDNGRGVDSGRSILSDQGDAIRNITGSATPTAGPGLTYLQTTGFTGALTAVSAVAIQPLTGFGASTPSQFTGIYLDASKSVPTASDNRPRNIAFNYILRAV